MRDPTINKSLPSSSTSKRDGENIVIEFVNPHYFLPSTKSSVNGSSVKNGIPIMKVHLQFRNMCKVFINEQMISLWCMNPCQFIVHSTYFDSSNHGIRLEFI